MIREALEPYKKLIISFLIIMTIIIIVGYAFIFDYYKDVHKQTYYIVTCKDPNKPGFTFEERYNSIQEFKDSPTICGLDKMANSIKTVDDIKLNLSFH